MPFNVCLHPANKVNQQQPYNDGHLFQIKVSLKGLLEHDGGDERLSPNLDIDYLVHVKCINFLLQFKSQLTIHLVEKH